MAIPQSMLMQTTKRYDMIKKEDICNIPRPLIYQKEACLYEKLTKFLIIFS